MSKKVVDTPIYIDTYKLVGIVKRARNVQWKTARLLSSMNTYVGILRTKDMRNVAERFRREVLTSFRRYLQWNDKKNCFALRARYGFRAVLRRKYKVRL